MKKASLLGLLISFTLLLCAQVDFQFADTSAVWNAQQTSTFGGPITFVYTIAGDTIIGAHHYQNLYTLTPAVVIHGPIRRDSSGKVFTKSSYDSVEVLIYDFGAHVGDTIPLKTYSIADLRVIVDSIDTPILDKPRKRMFVTYASDLFSLSDDPPVVPYREPDIWIDGIGALNTPFFRPGYQYGYDGGPFLKLCCFYEQDTAVFKQSDVTACLLSGLAPLKENVNIKVFPNPVTNRVVSVSLSNVYSVITTFQLFDLAGKLLFQHTINNNKTQLELPAIDSGVYFYSLSSESQPLAYGKLILQ